MFSLSCNCAIQKVNKLGRKEQHYICHDLQEQNPDASNKNELY